MLVRGLVAAAFTHRDSRAGDRDLHTHVAVSNKVQTLPEEGARWLALDGRVLYKAKVAASERYNTRLEAELVAQLGVRFTERLAPDGKRAIREIDGISPYLASTGPRADVRSIGAAPSSLGTSRPIMADRRPRWRPWRLRSRQRWRLAPPSTSHAPRPTSAPPGAPRRSTGSATRSTSRRCSAPRSATPSRSSRSPPPGGTVALRRHDVATQDDLRCRTAPVIFMGGWRPTPGHRERLQVRSTSHSPKILRRRSPAIA